MKTFSNPSINSKSALVTSLLVAETASNKKEVVLFTSNFVKSLTICVLVGIMFLVNASDVFAQSPPKRIAHLSNGVVVMDIPVDTIKSFLNRTISANGFNTLLASTNSIRTETFFSDSNSAVAITSISSVRIESSSDSVDTSYLYLLAFGGTTITKVIDGVTTRGGRTFGLQLEEVNGDIYLSALNAMKTTHECASDICDDCSIFKKDGCRCNDDKELYPDRLCNHRVMRTDGNEFTIIDDVYTWDYAAFYTLINNYK